MANLSCANDIPFESILRQNDKQNRFHTAKTQSGLNRRAAHEMLRKISKCSLWRERRICLSLTTALAITTFGNTRGIALIPRTMAAQLSSQRGPSMGRSTPGEPKFVKDRNGVTLFYPDGPSFRGYVVPDEQRRRALSDALDRYTKLDKLIGYPLAVPVVASIWSLGGPHTKLALLVLILTLVVAALANRVERRFCYSQLFAGLERVDAFDQSERRWRLRFSTLFYGGCGALVILRIVVGIHSGQF